MPPLTTPGQLVHRSELFHQLGQMTSSGLGVIQAFEVTERNPPQRWLRAPLARVVQSLLQGTTLAEALDSSGQWLSGFDKALLHAGEQSGQLPSCFKLLADYYASRAQLARQVIGLTLYPLIVFHIAVLIFPVSRLTDLILKGELLAFAAQKLAILIPVYGLGLLLWYSLQGARGPAWHASLERILAAVPILGTGRRQLAVARLSIALEALLNAGVTMIEAWSIAVRASGSPALIRVFDRAKPLLLSGTTPGEMVASSREFPPVFATLYRSGELSGRLDETLRRSHAMFQEEGSRRLKQFIFSTAGIIVALVMLGAAWQIIKFYLGYFQQVNDAINMQ